MSKYQALARVALYAAAAVTLISVNVGRSHFRTAMRQCIVACSQSHPPAECRSACAPF